MKLRQITLGFSILCISILSILFGTEVLLNLFDYNYHPLDVEINKILDKNDWRYRSAFKSNDFVYDKKLLWVPRKNLDIFNEQGFIGPLAKVNHQNDKIPSVSTDNFTIFAVGDSNTAGPPTGGRWPDYLGKLLEENSISVINAGVWGYSSYQGLGRLQEIVQQYRPNIVLVSFGCNDAHQVLIPDKNWNNYSEFSQNNINVMFSGLKLGVLAQEYLDKIRILQNKNNKLVPRVSVEDYKENLVKMIDIAKANNIQIVLLTRPYVYYDNEKENPNPNWWKTYAPLYRQATIDIASTYNIPLLDVYLEFENKTTLFVDESHFTDEGHKIMANYIYNSIKNLIPSVVAQDNF
jgi:lysophospholipase L1-like esterase